VDGASKDVGHLIPGILERTAITDDLRKRVARVSANCEAEIIR
jgi:pyruvate-ferredoxin/flavodoxin oxidoreductase